VHCVWPLNEIICKWVNVVGFDDLIGQWNVRYKSINKEFAGFKVTRFRIFFQITQFIN
jgi:hypothetical protein